MSLHVTRWHLLQDARAVAREAARRILAAADRSLEQERAFRIVLSGGTTPGQAYALLRQAESDWSGWEIYFGDERCLPPEDPRRNSRMARDLWLDHVAIPPRNIHIIPAELGPEAAARAYTPVVSEALPFAMVLLGLGEDGHTASLFPGHDHDPDELVHAIHQAPKPPPDRVSLSTRALSETAELLILVTGQGKREAVRRWQAGEPLPVAAITCRHGVDVLIDRSALP